MEYIEVMNSISLPTQVEPNDLVALLAIIDHTQSIARYELAIMERQYERFKTLLKIKQQQLFNGMKQHILNTNPGQTRATEAEVTSAIQDSLMNTPFDQLQFGAATLYDLYFSFQNCYTFLKTAVVDALRDKRESLITASAAMKILVPGPNQYQPQQQFVPQSPYTDQQYAYPVYDQNGGDVNAGQQGQGNQLP
jgi:hypothetical protein